MKLAILVPALLFFAGSAFSQGAVDDKTALEEKAVLAAEHAWLEATKKCDVNAFQTLLREDYMNLDIDGHIQNKVDVLKATDALASNPKNTGGPVLSMSAVRVRFYAGHEVAVLTGGAGLGGPKGSPIRFTHVWVKTRDTWQLSTSQTTRIAPLPPHAPVKIEHPH